MTEATILRGQGKTVKRVSGRPYVDSTPEIDPSSRSGKSEAGLKSEIPEKSGGGQGNSDLSAISAQISTSMESVKKEMRSWLEQFEARPKNVELA